ncbi:hypothetical protein LINPERPRIM_LOCUS4735, partial [Linum perenne]
RLTHKVPGISKGSLNFRQLLFGQPTSRKIRSRSLFFSDESSAAGEPSPSPPPVPTPSELMISTTAPSNLSGIVAASIHVASAATRLAARHI